MPCAGRVSPAVRLIEASVLTWWLHRGVGAAPQWAGPSCTLCEEAMHAVARKPYGERMGNRIGGSVALGLTTFLLAGCASPTPPTWVEDVCNIHASWVSSDRPQADEERLASSLRNAVPAGADAAVESAGDQLVATCTEAGSKPPEG